MDSTLLLGILSPLGAAALTGIGIAYRDWRKDKTAAQQRQWDKEDREDSARELAKHTEKVTVAQTGQLLAAVADNTSISKEAFTEANGHAAKYGLLNTRMDAMEVLLQQIIAKLP